jgi:hypothetical protein
MSHVIVGDNRAIVMPDDEPIEATRARRAIAHPRAKIEEVTSAWHPEIGINGALELTVRAYLYGDVLLAGLPDGLDHPTGDGGGQGDQKIAMVAREVTGETDVDAVVKVLLSRVIRGPGDLVRAFGGTNDCVTLKARQELAAALGLVEAPSPEWATIGAWVYSPVRQEYARILSCAPDGSFRVGEAYSAPVPQGLIDYAWRPLADAPVVRERARRDGIVAAVKQAIDRLDDLEVAGKSVIPARGFEAGY